MRDASAAILERRSLEPHQRAPNWVSIFQFTVIAVLLVVVYRSAIDAIVYKWRTDGNWSHGWLVPVFSLYFVLGKRHELAATPRRTNYFGLPLIVGSFVIYYLFVRWNFGYPQYFSIIPCLMGVVLFIGGWGVFKRVWFPIAFLIFAIPLPQSIYFNVTLPLRKIASLAASAVLDVLPNVDTEVNGVVIDYMHGARVSSLNVQEACSGMRLIMAFGTLGAAMAYLGDRPLWQRGVMLVCVIPIAIFCNAIRVLVTGMLHIYGHEDLAQGTAHSLIGLAMLPLALGLFALCGYVLSNLFVDEGEEQ